MEQTEQEILEKGRSFSENKDQEGLRQLFKEIRPLFQHMPKAKTAKIVRNLLDLASKIPNS